MFGDLGLGRVLDPRLLQTKRGAGAWQRRKWVFRCAVKCLGAGFWVDPIYPNAPNSSWCLLLVSLSLNIFLLILCVSLSNPFPVSDSLFFSLCPFFSDSAGRRPGCFLLGWPICLCGVSLVHSPPHSGFCRMCPTRPRCPRASESAP